MKQHDHLYATTFPDSPQAGAEPRQAPEPGSQRDGTPRRARGQGSGRGEARLARGGSWSPPGTQAVPFAIRSFQDSNAESPVTSFIVMQLATGHTAEHRLQPMHSLSSTHTMWAPRAFAAASARSRVGARWPLFSSSSELWMQWTAESRQAT